MPQQNFTETHSVVESVTWKHEHMEKLTCKAEKKKKNIYIYIYRK
jgi:hypothetical protein